jgi:hypothetical protein
MKTEGLGERIAGSGVGTLGKATNVMRYSLALTAEK